MIDTSTEEAPIIQKLNDVIEGRINRNGGPGKSNNHTEIPITLESSEYEVFRKWWIKNVESRYQTIVDPLETDMHYRACRIVCGDIHG